MKSLNHFLPVLHIFVLLASILMRLFITGRIDPQSSSKQVDFIFILFFILYFTTITALTTGTYLLAGIRFYKNLFTDEGYLTKTLPVTNGTHLLSKTIAGSIWAVINMSLIYLCTYLVLCTPYIRSEVAANKDEILREFGVIGEYADLSLPAALTVLFLFSCLGSISSIVMIYASVALGQLFSSHRVLGAVVSYFAISTVLSVLSLACMALFGGETRLILTAGSMGDDFNFIAYMIDVMKSTTILMVGTSVALYIMTQYIMNKKINLI